MLLDNIDYKVYRQVQCFSYQNSLVETIAESQYRQRKKVIQQRSRPENSINDSLPYKVLSWFREVPILQSL